MKTAPVAYSLEKVPREVREGKGRKPEEAQIQQCAYLGERAKPGQSMSNDAWKKPVTTI